MELAILGALAAAGYVLSPSQDASRRRGAVLLPKASAFSPFPPPSGASSKGSIAAEVGASAPPDDLTIQQLQQALAQDTGNRLALALDPSNQAIAGDRRFFMTSQKTQNYRPEIVQQKMELFTGAVNEKTSAYGTWRPKREITPMFSPDVGYAPVTSDGKGVQNVSYNREEYERFVSGKQNNVTPTQQVQVGRGIGIPLEQTAGNGFHYDMNRILPRNVGEHKLNRDMKPRVGGGYSRVSQRTAAMPVVKVGPVKFWTLDRYPLGPGRAAVTAHARRPREPRAVCFGTKRDAEERDYLGIATHALTKEGPVPAHAVRATRPESRCDDVWPLPSLNVTMRASTHPRGTYAKNVYDCSRMVNQNREKTVQKEGQGNVGGVTQKGTVPTTSFAMAPTKRALVPSFGCKRNG